MFVLVERFAHLARQGFWREGLRPEGGGRIENGVIHYIENGVIHYLA